MTPAESGSGRGIREPPPRNSLNHHKRTVERCDRILERLSMCYAPCCVARMTIITHRELRNNSADVLRRVAAGEAMEVTNNGTVVAYISPAPTPAMPFPVSRPARRGGGWSALPRVPLTHAVSEILDEERADD